MPDNSLSKHSHCVTALITKCKSILLAAMATLQPLPYKRVSLVIMFNAAHVRSNGGKATTIQCNQNLMLINANWLPVIHALNSWSSADHTKSFVCVLVSYRDKSGARFCSNYLENFPVAPASEDLLQFKILWSQFCPLRIDHVFW